jgi:hypothetical protein
MATLIEKENCDDYALDVETPTDKLYASRGCNHVWERAGYTPSYKLLEDRWRIQMDKDWFWIVAKCHACGKVRIDKIYVSKEDSEAEDT